MIFLFFFFPLSYYYFIFYYIALVNLYDYEQVAQKKLTKSIWGYYSSGADDQKTLKKNRTTLSKKISILPKALRGNQILKNDIELNREKILNSNLSELDKKKFILGINTDVVLFENNPSYRIQLSSPICVAPTAMQKMAHPDGEIGTARACAK